MRERERRSMPRKQEMYASLLRCTQPLTWFERPVGSMTSKSKPEWRSGYRRGEWRTTYIDRDTGMVILKTFNKRGQLLGKEKYYDPQYVHWPIKVFDKTTGMVTWKKFDKHGNLQVKEFYVRELHDPEFKPPQGWALYCPQPPAE